jgi:glycosyltransferase involved in cell wall biosynthesis
VLEPPAVTVILPTRAIRERADCLARAVESIATQSGVRAIPLVVINGPSADPELCRELEADRRLRIARLEAANLPAALRRGRELVDTPWFAELDDDDALLPGGLALRVAALAGSPDCDVVITNGIRRAAAGDTLQVRDPAAVTRDPLRALLDRHWLMPGSYLCRTATVGPQLFDGMPQYLENTFLAVRFATGYRIQFIDVSTIVRHLDTPHSESKSWAYEIGQVEALRCLLTLEMPADVRRRFQRRVADACHSVSGRALAEGFSSQAWSWHLRSLIETGGWRYLPYTRHLVRAWWR